MVDGKTFAVRMIYRATPEMSGDAALYTFEGYEISDPGAIDRGRSSKEPLDVRGAPGSGFTVAELAAQFKSDNRAFSQPSAGKAGQRIERVEGWIAPSLAKWGEGAPAVRVVADAEGLPARAKTFAGYKTADGYYDDIEKVVYLVADKIPTQLDALRVLAHEAVGHYGIEAITGTALWEQIANAVARMRESGKHEALFREVDRRYRGANAQIALRETLAVMAERGVRNSVMDRALAAIRAFVRNTLGIKLDFTPAELRQHLVAAARYVRGDARPQAAASRAAPAEPAFSKGVRSAFSDAMNFSTAARAFLDGKLPGTQPIQVTEGTPDVYVKLGAPDVPILIQRGTIKKLALADSDGKRPEISHNLFLSLVRRLHEPIAVFSSATQKDGLVVLTEVVADGKPVMVSIHVRDKHDRIVVTASS